MSRRTRLVADVIVHNIGRLVTPARAQAPLRGPTLGMVVEVEHAAIAISNGRIVAVGPERQVRADVDSDVDTEFVDADGALALPGLVDCHAHPVFGGDRAGEFELRNLGRPYEEIHAAGGGIRSTVAATRTALDDGSIDTRVRRHLDWMLAAGTTTAEGKSGYGLTVEHELESLRALQRVAAEHPLRVVQTVLAAHTVPAEYDGRTDDYLDEVAIPAVQQAAEAGLATAADVFLERGSFDATQSQRYLAAAREAGLTPRLHGSQFSEQGSVAVAEAVGARSIDHLEALDEDGVRELSRTRIAGVLLPLSSLFLSRPYAPGRALIDAGAVVALASDFNPGSSFGESLTLAMSLAGVGCGLTVGEALSAATINAAWVLGLHDQVGRLAPGFAADVLLLDQPDLRHVAYHVGTPGVRSVLVGGRVVVPSV